MKTFQLLSFFLVCSCFVWAQTPAQWRGPDRSGIYYETKLLKEWPAEGPVMIWSAEGMIYCQDEKTGNVGLVKPDPLKFTLISSFKAPLWKGPYWAHPSISNGILYIRHGDVLMAYDIRKK